MSSDNLIGFSIFAAVVLIVVITICSLVNALHLDRNQTFTVTGKAVVTSSKSSLYLVYTDRTTYAVEDSLIHRRWDSSDVYGKLEVGKTYTADLQGYRIPFFSMYPNLINIRLSKETK